MQFLIGDYGEACFGLCILRSLKTSPFYGCLAKQWANHLNWSASLPLF